MPDSSGSVPVGVAFFLCRRGVGVPLWGSFGKTDPVLIIFSHYPLALLGCTLGGAAVMVDVGRCGKQICAGVGVEG
jgi:hypothetical protein